MSERRLRFGPEQRGERLDKALARALPDLSRAHCQQLIREGMVTINDRPAKSSLRLRGDERVVVTIPQPTNGALVGEAIPLDIRYEDDDLIVVNKPSGMVVHPSAGHEHGTLVHAVLSHCPDITGVGGERRPGIVHRLDKDTSGLIVVAKNDQAMVSLQRQFKERSVEKVYRALVEGRFERPEALIDAPIGRDPRDRKRMAVIAPGGSARSRPAQTRVRRVRLFGELTYVECRPITGRTHQIRVHLAFAGYPIVGDPLYGRRRPTLDFDRTFLHAATLAFNPPSGGKRLTFQAELPPELQLVLNGLSGASGP